MKKKKLFITVGIIMLITVIGLCTWKTAKMIWATEDESLRWTKISALGSWAGSFFAAVALIVSLFAFWLPQKVKLGVDFSSGILLTQIPGTERINAYTITVKNIGMRSVTINNIYLNFGGRHKNDIFFGMLNQDSLLQAYTPSFPKRLDQGESFDYYLLKDKLDAGLAHYEKNTAYNTPLYIRVNEVTKGNLYYKTKWTLDSFITHTEEKLSSAT